MLIFSSSSALFPSFFLPSTTTKFHQTPKDRKNHHQHIVGRQDYWILVWEWRTQDVSSPRCVFFITIFYYYLLLQVNYFYSDHNDNQQQQQQHHHQYLAAAETVAPAAPTGVATTAGAGLAAAATMAGAAAAVAAGGSRHVFVVLLNLFLLKIHFYFCCLFNPFKYYSYFYFYL